MNKIKGNMTFLNANRKNKGLSVLRGSFLNKIKRRVTLTISQLFDLLMTVLLSKKLKKKKKNPFSLSMFPGKFCLFAGKKSLGLLW